MSATDITTSHTIWFKDPACLDQSLVGGKGVNLGRLGNAGFAVPGGFVVSTGAYDAHIAGIRERICLECAVAGLHEPFSWHDGPEGCPQWAADDRYEQSVRTTGLIEVAGRTVEFESVGHRDHSWGTRDWRPLQHWKWINATTVDHAVSLHGWISYALGDRQVNGYVSRGGEVSAIVAAESTAELREDFMHTSVTGSFVDATGRELVLEATSVAGLPIPARHMQMNEVACTATLDGAPAVAHIELGWPGAYLQDYVAEGAEPRVETRPTGAAS